MFTDYRPQNGGNSRCGYRRAYSESHKSAEYSFVLFKRGVRMRKNRFFGLPGLIYVSVNIINVVCRSPLNEFCNIKFEIKSIIDFSACEINSRYRGRTFVKNVTDFGFFIVVNRGVNRGRTAENQALYVVAYHILSDFERIYIRSIEIVKIHAPVRNVKSVVFFRKRAAPRRNAVKPERNILVRVESIYVIVFAFARIVYYVRKIGSEPYKPAVVKDIQVFSVRIETIYACGHLHRAKFIPVVIVRRAIVKNRSAKRSRRYIVCGVTHDFRHLIPRTRNVKISVPFQKESVVDIARKFYAIENFYAVFAVLGFK